MIAFAIGVVGWTILYTVSPIEPSTSDLHVRYFGVICVVVAGCESLPPLPSPNLAVPLDASMLTLFTRPQTA